MFFSGFSTVNNIRSYEHLLTIDIHLFLKSFSIKITGPLGSCSHGNNWWWGISMGGGLRGQSPPTRSLSPPKPLHSPPAAAPHAPPWPGRIQGDEQRRWGYCWRWSSGWWQVGAWRQAAVGGNQQQHLAVEMPSTFLCWLQPCYELFKIRTMDLWMARQYKQHIQSPLLCLFVHSQREVYLGLN